MVAGSVWPEDMEVLIPFINNHDLKFIIAPHEIHESFMERMERELQKHCIRYSSGDLENSTQADVLIIDNVGMLSSLYAYATYAWVGGAYGKGLHNILEAAVYGCPVFFGNRNYEKFREARDLINLGGAIAVENYMELKEQFAMFSDPETFTIARQINAEYIESNRGATSMIVKYCRNILT
jgi:3-deoxy-D-manno-octulosonic-acid transferase